MTGPWVGVGLSTLFSPRCCMNRSAHRLLLHLNADTNKADVQLRSSTCPANYNVLCSHGDFCVLYCSAAIKSWIKKRVLLKIMCFILLLLLLCLLLGSSCLPYEDTRLGMRIGTKYTLCVTCVSFSDTATAPFCPFHLHAKRRHELAAQKCLHESLECYIRLLLSCRFTWPLSNVLLKLSAVTGTAKH